MTYPLFHRFIQPFETIRLGEAIVHAGFEAAIEQGSVLAGIR